MVSQSRAAAAPSGASTLVPAEASGTARWRQVRFTGKGVTKAVGGALTARRAQAILGKDAKGLRGWHRLKIASTLDGTENKSNFGASAFLAVSLANAEAAAAAKGMPLYEHIAELNGTPGKYSIAGR